MDFNGIIETGEGEALKIIQESSFLKDIKMKLMDYASSKYAFSNIGFNSKGFSEYHY